MSGVVSDLARRRQQWDGLQLQSPLFVTLLVYLLLRWAQLSGVFEVGGGLAASATI